VFQQVEEGRKARIPPGEGWEEGGREGGALLLMQDVPFVRGNLETFTQDNTACTCCTVQ
jgi:hypothetical protein